MKFNIFDSGKSVSQLRSRCLRLFKRILKVEVYAPMSQNFHWRNRPLNEIRNVVLMGDALLLLTNPFLWAKNVNYRFWVLSESHRILIHKMFGLKKNQMTVIPRSLLFTSARKVHAWPDFKKSATLVISSRIDKEKNIDLTLHFAYEFQKMYPRLSIAIFSPSHDLKQLKEDLASFNWMRKPKIYGDAGHQWHRKHKLPQPFLVCLSTYVMEDFNVVSAQAREIGWPMILSNWAIFRELGNESIIRINADDIFSYRELKNKAVKRKLVLQLVTEALLNMQQSKSSNLSATENKLKVPKITSSNDLQKLQKKWPDEKRLELVTGFFDDKLRDSNAVVKEIRKLFS